VDNKLGKVAPYGVFYEKGIKIRVTHVVVCVTGVTYSFDRGSAGMLGRDAMIGRTRKHPDPLCDDHVKSTIVYERLGVLHPADGLRTTSRFGSSLRPT